MDVTLRQLRNGYVMGLMGYLLGHGLSLTTWLALADSACSRHQGHCSACMTAGA